MKLQNVLLDKDYKLKIADFGFSIPLKGREGKSGPKTKLGTPGYQAPELLTEERQYYSGVGVDIFASGVMVFILLTGFPPINEGRLTDSHYKIIANKDIERFKKYNLRQDRISGDDPSLCPHFRDLIFSLLAHNPEERMILGAIEEHPWLVGDPPAAAQ